jgi:hypothetical protein
MSDEETDVENDDDDLLDEDFVVENYDDAQSLLKYQRKELSPVVMKYS